MHTSLNLSKNTRPDHGQGNAEYINTKTIQHMDEAKVVMKDCKFKDVMKNHYSIMFFFEDELKLMSVF